MGQRIAKHIYDSDNNWEKSSFYVRDAQGNVMSVYEYSMQDMVATYKLKEQHIYGSSRLGMLTDTLEMIAASTDSINYKRILGKKRYELSNHLGNVLTVVTDKIIPVDADTDGETDYYLSHIVSATDYYPFGVKMPGRDLNDTPHRISFQGQEEDEETDFVVYKYRNYNPKERRFDQPDPLAANYPYNSTYAFSENSVIGYIELEGKETIIYHKKNEEFWKNYQKIIKSSDVLNKTLNEEISKPELKNKVVVLFLVANRYNIGGADGRLDSRIAATANAYVNYMYKKNQGQKTTLDEDNNFDSWKKKFNDLGIDEKNIAKLAAAHKSGIKVYGIVLASDLVPENFSKKEIQNWDKAVNTIAHEIIAHLKNAINSSSKSVVEEHKDYFNTEENKSWYEKHKQTIDTEYSPDYKELPKNSPAGEIREEINKTTKKVLE